MKKKQISPVLDFAKIILFVMIYVAIVSLLAKCNKERNRKENQFSEVINQFTPHKVNIVEY